MKYKTFLYVTAFFLTLGIFASLSKTFAQDGVYDSETGRMTAPGGAIVDETSDAQPAGTTVAEDVFNPLWLLPLIAIPILVYLLWPRKKEHEAMEMSGEYAGVKGGRAVDEDEVIESEHKKHRDQDHV